MTHSNVRFSHNFLIALLTAMLTLWTNMASAQSSSNYRNSVPNATLRVSINGQIVEGDADFIAENISDQATLEEKISENSVNLSPGDKVQLQVELVDSSNHSVDVTNSPYTMYESLSDVLATVSNTGTITAVASEPSAGTAKDIGGIFIAYGDGVNQSGWNRIWLRLK